METFLKYFFYVTSFSLLSVFGWYTELAISEDYGYFYSVLAVIVFILFILSAVFLAFRPLTFGRRFDPLVIALLVCCLSFLSGTQLFRINLPGVNRVLELLIYNLFRLKFLLETFPDARILLCIRNPVQQAMSMARVHGEFSRLAAGDLLFGNKLDSLGHFEFGPNRKPVTVNSDGCMRAETFWAQGDDYRGYLQQWIDVYSFVRDQYFSDDETKCQILLVNYGRFVADPTSEIRRIADFCHLETTETFLRDATDRVDSSPTCTAYLDSGDQEDQAIKLYNDILNLV